MIPCSNALLFRYQSDKNTESIWWTVYKSRSVNGNKNTEGCSWILPTHIENTFDGTGNKIAFNLCIILSRLFKSDFSLSTGKSQTVRLKKYAHKSGIFNVINIIQFGGTFSQSYWICFLCIFSKYVLSFDSL